MGMITGLLCGVVNGYFVAYVGMPSFVVTLGMLSFARSLAVVLSVREPAVIGQVMLASRSAESELHASVWLELAPVAPDAVLQRPMDPALALLEDPERGVTYRYDIAVAPDGRYSLTIDPVPSQSVQLIAEANEGCAATCAKAEFAANEAKDAAFFDMASSAFWFAASEAKAEAFFAIASSAGRSASHCSSASRCS